MEQGVVLTDNKDGIREVMAGDRSPVIHGGHLFFNSKLCLISHRGRIRRFQYV